MDVLRSFYIGCVLLLVSVLIILGISNTDSALVCLFHIDYSKGPAHPSIVDLNFNTKGVIKGDKDNITRSSVGLWTVCLNQQCKTISTFNNTGEAVFNIVTRGLIVASGAVTLALLIWVMICFVKLWERPKLTVTLFVLHYILLLMSAINYSLYIRYARPYTVDCYCSWSLSMIWVAFLFSLFGLWIVAFIIGDSMSQRAADKARRATFAPLILSENAGRTDESTLNNIKQDYIESDEPNSSL
ncbi:uncharacterized protein LOC142349822 [Convolutriloba macropyga]|uniref:uncharacterized protein LOC142349822 n=1 Tax=Convolutriloba macropyga TaxID=536237 RepID=UPI003F527196